MERYCTFVVIGGGIAGTSCAEFLSLNDPNASVLLVTASPVVKTAVNVVQLTKTLTQMDVEEVEAKEVFQKHPGMMILTDEVTKLDADAKIVHTSKGCKINYKKLCICTGGRPNLIDENSPYVIGIRDTESVVEFERRVAKARRMVVVGNGGIATEIIHEIKGIEKVWVVKDDHISKTFLDAGAGEFLRSKLSAENEDSQPVIKRIKYVIGKEKNSGTGVAHAALGPDWHSHFKIIGNQSPNSVTVEYNVTVARVESGEGDWPIRVYLCNGNFYDADFIVSATGVIPNVELFKTGNEELKVAEDGGILVDWKMETSLPDVFAAGDACTAAWEHAQHWHQMRLWTQARQMGFYAGKCMDASYKGLEIMQDFCFEIFSHVTKFFGYKVVLLGLFNGQKLNNEYEILLRVTKGREYVKVILKDGKMQGALLIGETDLEEMCENLILNQLDLSPYGEDLLNPNIDIEDYFD